MIIAKIKSRARYFKKNEKYGIKAPKNMADAKKFDEKNGNTLWQDAIAKRLANVNVTFKIMNDNEEAPHGYQFVKCHMIFDVKMEDFRRR